jgi:hypothetical protein
MAVGWLTQNGTAGPPEVRFGTASGAYPNSALGSTSRYFEHYHHDAVLRNLTAATQYFYKVGTSGGNFSSERSFNTSDVLSPDGAFSCGIFGDMGVNSSSSTISRLRQQPGLRFLLHVGDISYADDLGSKIEPDPGPNEKYDGGRGYEAVYDLFGDMIEPLTETMPYLVTPGNHDVSCHVTSDTGCIDGHKNFSAFNHRFRMPSVESGSAAAPTPPPSAAAPARPPAPSPPAVHKAAGRSAAVGSGRAHYPTPASLPPPRHVASHGGAFGSSTGASSATDSSAANSASITTAAANAAANAANANANAAPTPPAAVNARMNMWYSYRYQVPSYSAAAFL